MRDFALNRLLGTRYDGIIHDFVLLNAIRELPEVKTALRQASDGIRVALKP